MKKLEFKKVLKPVKNLYFFLYKFIKKLLKKEWLVIISILIFGFVVRLYKINNPVADWHSWRQADTASVTREYIKHGINILYPTYHDISSIQTGIFNPKGYRFVEFPIFNVIHVLFVKLLPFSLEVSGRLVSILSSLVSVFLIYLIGKRLYGKEVGLIAAFFLSFLPFNIYFSRVILPEPMSATLGLLSLFLFIVFMQDEKKPALYLSGIFLSVGMMVKPFIVFYTVPMLYLIDKKYGFKKVLKDPKAMIPLSTFAAISLIPFFAWRIWLNQFPIGTPFYKWMFNGDGIRFKPSFWRWIFSERLGNLILGVWGLIPFSFGILSQKGKNQFANFFLLGLVFYVSIFATVNVRHDYYQTISIPAIALTLALGVKSMWEMGKKDIVVGALLFFSVFVGLDASAIQIKEFYKINHPEIITAGQEVKKLTNEDDLVVAPYDGDTALLYQTGRRGWPAVDTDFDTIIKRGAKYFVSVTLTDPDIKLLKERGYKVVEETKQFIIIDLTSKE